MRSIAFATAAVFLFGLASEPVAGNLWTGEGNDNLWTNAENWSQSVVPLGATSDPRFGWDDPTGDFYPLTPDTSDDGPLLNNDVKLQADGTITLIDDSVTLAQAYGVRVGNGGATNTLQITGGVLEIGGVPPSGGDRIGWHLQVGRGYPGFDGGPVNENPLATVLMSGGTINTNGLLIPEQFVNHDLADPTDSAPLNGELIMSGGTINARWMNLGQLKGNGRAKLTNDAEINLWPNLTAQRNNGGMLLLNRDWYLDGQPVPSSGTVSFDISDDASVNIFGHRSETSATPDQTEIDRYQQFINDGLLTANNGTADPILTLQDCPSDGSLDHLCVSGTMITITAPEREVAGDFNLDGNWDCDDINALILEIAAGTDAGSFDLDGDGVLTTADRDAWLVEAGAVRLASMNAFPVGDLDLNGSVDSTDLGLLLNNFSANNGVAYCGGDIDGDSMVNSTDLGLLLNNFGTTVTATTVSTVPEPRSGLMISCVLGTFVWLRATKSRFAALIERV